MSPEELEAAVKAAQSAGDTAWVSGVGRTRHADDSGLALFYGGLVRPKNVLSTLMHSFFILGLISVAMGPLGVQPRIRSVA